MDFGLLMLRATVGLTLAAHGAQKLFGWFGGYGLERTAQAFESLGFQPGRRSALRAGLTELAGGLLLTAGLLSPLGAALVASVMLVAAITVHVKNGFFSTSGGYELNLVLGLVGLAIAFTGPGAFSLDALAGLPLHGALWGIGAAILSIAGATIQLAQRRVPAAVHA